MAEAPIVEASPRAVRPPFRGGTAVALAATVVLGGLLVAGTLNRGHNWGGDFAGYLLQAKSIIEGRPGAELAANRFTITHSPGVLGPVAYPWGFPVLLAPVLAASGIVPLALKAVGALAWLGLLVLLAIGMTRAHPGPWRVALVAFFAVDPAILGLTNQVLSDLPFLLVATAAMLWMDRVVAGRRPVGDGAILAVLLAFAFFLRTNGLLLLPTFAVAQGVAGWRRRTGRTPAGNAPPGWQALVPYAGFAALVAAWRLALPGGGSSHLALLEAISPATLHSNLVYYGHLPDHFFRGVPHPHAVWLATVPLAVLGAGRRGWAGFHQVAWILGTVALYVLWPAHQGIRFLLPVLPFYLSFALTGLAWLAGGVGARARGLRTAACLVPVVVVLALLGRSSVARVRANLRAERQLATGPFSPPARALFHFLSTRTPADATVVFFKPRVMRLMTGRRALWAADAAGLAVGDVVCLSAAAPPHRQPSRQAMAAWVAAGRARVIFENRRFRVYALGAPPPRPPGAGAP